jgi:hypothetical protein
MTREGISALSLLLGEVPSDAVSACTTAVTSVAQTAFGVASRIDWTGLAADLDDKIKEMFEIDLAQVVAGAWNDFREIQECADRTKHSVDETIFVPLVDHHVDAKFKPYLDIAIGTLPALRVRFEIVIDIELRGVVAKIQDATIWAFRVGSCQASATVKCEGTVVFEQPIMHLALPGEITLHRGIQIAARSADPVPGVSESSRDRDDDNGRFPR